MLSLLFALLAGVVTIAAPCTLPILPILLGASLGRATTVRPALIALGFVTSFTALALLIDAITRSLNFDPNVLRDAAIVMLIVFGLLMISPTPFERMSAYVRGFFGNGNVNSRSNEGYLSGFILGTTLGLVWTPCAGPVLGSILALIATSKDTTWAGLQLLLYAIGASIPLLAIAYGGQKVTGRLRSLARIAPRLQRAFGLVTIAFGMAMYLQYDTVIVAWLTQFYPDGQIGL